MIKFFRHIRQRVIQENRVSRYMLYAIGEIVLVVIGILIALQVNNWNQQRIASQKEHLLLEALNKEFRENKTQLEGVIAVHERSLVSAQFMISLFPIDPETINLDTLEAMKHWGNWNTFNPSQGVIRSLVNSSSFELISNPELRVLLVSWEDVLADYKEEENIAVKDLYEHLYPLMSTHLSWGSGFKSERTNRAFLTTVECENVFRRRANILGTILGKDSYDAEIEQIRTTINRIIELSEIKN